MPALRRGEALEETREIIKKVSHAECDAEYNIKKIAKEIIPKYRIKKEEINKEDEEKMGKAVMDLRFENDLSIIEAVEGKYRGMMLELKRNIIKEYGCKTFSEKALVDLAVNAYSRNLTMSRMLVNTTTAGHTTKELNIYLSIMSKDIDRANRHFVTAIETLKQFKQPNLKVNIKSKNAFIVDKQQFVNNQNNQNENIKAK